MQVDIRVHLVRYMAEVRSIAFPNYHIDVNDHLCRELISEMYTPVSHSSTPVREIGSVYPS